MENFEIEGMGILGIEEVKIRTGCEVEEIEEMVTKGSFPEQVLIEGKSVGWLENEIEEWNYLQILMSSWKKVCPWNARNYKEIRRVGNNFMTTLRSLEDVKGECGIICERQVKELVLNY